MNKLIFMAMTALVCVSAGATDISDADSKIVGRIKEANSKYTTITSSFKQTRHMPILGEDILSGGKFYYEKPEKLSMQYDNPEGDLMLINGDKFVMSAGGRQREVSARSNAKMRGMKNILSACISGDLTQMDAKKITCSENSKYYIVTADIDRTANKSNITQVVLSYDKNDLSIAILQTIEADGSYTIYELTGKKFNQPIAEAIFATSGARG